MLDSGRTVHRVTCAVGHSKMRGKTAELLFEMGIAPVLLESGRSARRLSRRRRLRLLGRVGRLDNSPVDIYQFSLPPERSDAVIHQVAAVLGINRPGRGTIYVQETTSFVGPPSDRLVLPDDAPPRVPGLLRDLSLITCIMSMSGTGEELARLAVELGTGVPIVTLGTGTGMRDRLGLLRITVPAEKELVHLLVPALDAEGLMRMLIEEGRLHRPGKGFLYSRPVLHGFLDTSLHIGPQEHPASMEQVIAAIDELEKSTTWRSRFPAIDSDARFQMQHDSHEITLVCAEEQSPPYTKAAMRAGAGGSTTARLRQIEPGATGGGARERCTIIVPRSRTEQVLAALMQTHHDGDEPLLSLDIQPAPLSFSHRPIRPTRTRH